VTVFSDCIVEAMTFRERMKRRSDLGHAILVVACVAAFFSAGAPRTRLIWITAMGLIGIVIARVPPAGRCPKCKARIWWGAWHITWDKDCTRCPKCGESFDSPIGTEQRR
jgi:hypothetical protein